MRFIAMFITAVCVLFLIVIIIIIIIIIYYLIDSATYNKPEEVLL